MLHGCDGRRGERLEIDLTLTPDGHSAGDLALVPPMAPHALSNAGDETVKVVGFFSKEQVTSTFEGPVEPFRTAVVEQGAPAPAS